jgi:inosine-uridine nucleoside N-ribohydrolase
MMLNSPELDVKLIVTSNANTLYRAKIVCKLLDAARRTDIPVGIGIHTSMETGAQELWVQDYSMSDYPGTVLDDGVGALIDFIMNADEPVTLISIGPLTNVAAALERKPDIAARAQLIGMQGSIYMSYNGSTGHSTEYNVAVDVTACRKAFTAPWDVTITPLDTCGIIKLTGNKYRQVRDSPLPLTHVLMENYRIWDKHYTDNKFSLGYENESTILYDTVAIYLAFSEELLLMEDLGIVVTDDGHTLIDASAKKIRCAVGWKNLDQFEDLLVHRLI